MGFTLDGVIVIAVAGNLKLSQIFQMPFKKYREIWYKIYMVEPQNIHIKYDIII